MGGGDLNLKKSWHPHTMKNQERVWKAEEQAKMEERKLQDLRKEINEERDREELRRLGESSGVLSNNGGAAGEAKLEWMYKNSTELINREEYLLGRKIDKSFETLQAEESRKEQNTVGLKQTINHVEHDCVPFSIRTYRNVQSNEQVDIQRKTLEDPLMLIKQREMESRRKLLENPVKLKEIHRILKTEQEQKTAQGKKKNKKSKKSKKSKKKKKNRRSSDDESSDSESNDSDDDLDRKLARQVSKLKGDQGDLKLDKLLDAKYRTISNQLDMATKKKKSKKSKKKKSSDSSDESSDEEEKPRRQRSREPQPRRKHKRSHSSEDRNHRERCRSRSPRDRKKRHSRSPEQRRRQWSPEERRERRRSRSRSPLARRTRSPEDRKARHQSKDTSKHREKRSSRTPEERSRSKRSRSRSFKRDVNRRITERPPPSRPTGKPKLSEADREARLREMMDNATWREADRSQVVRKHREAYAREEAQNRERDFDKEFINKEVKKAIANHNSIGDRIRANLNNIQRTASSMDSNFARK
ncbi:pre-mRNA-splicing factor CWC25 homolog [Drosophila sechellia]|uniref:GM18360 n=1 Tax=Drosophila sechellia TaxID=7238 RepID=B4I2P2_DROSE|nr:pre-mRNA-splicing factor CWC25 homolog [Drosophila sechellia]EDW54037.1 GM18360 [Drosophila sechellia]